MTGLYFKSMKADLPKDGYIIVRFKDNHPTSGPYQAARVVNGTIRQIGDYFAHDVYETYGEPDGWVDVNDLDSSIRRENRGEVK